MTAWLRHHTRQSGRQAAGCAKTARRLRALPVTAGAYRDGVLTVAAVAAVGVRRVDERSLFPCFRGYFRWSGTARDRTSNRAACTPVPALPVSPYATTTPICASPARPCVEGAERGRAHRVERPAVGTRKAKASVPRRGALHRKGTVSVCRRGWRNREKVPSSKGRKSPCRGAPASDPSTSRCRSAIWAAFRPLSARRGSSDPGLVLPLLATGRG